MDTLRISQWLNTSGKPVIISGPCSAESETQMLDTARQLAKSGRVHALRGGVWKPRTRPGQYEGAGEPALRWITQASAETGLPVATEVANAGHVEACLKAGVDILWIGARTTVNPFYVQEIADALQGVDIPVLVKNPVNPDLELWIGALERIYKSGIRKLAAVHRGFSSSDKSIYRNAPMWEIPIALKTRFPELDIVCDPSHISGNREWIAQISQKAFDLNMAGLMVESHIHPDEALSDAKQQLTPKVLIEILGSLVVRKQVSDNSEFQNELAALREKIDRLDEEMIHKLAERMNVSKTLGRFKKDNNVTVLQLKRWEEIIDTRTALAEELGLEEKFTLEILKQIHLESIRLQTEIMNKKAEE